ncbi:4107_t:CDS:2 [Dentiscutata erythropus]|uniref:4107_t:CDS:1 n=1 Tax=Dentiscutata erythropus TaxID=1348616 RepID=A0A9N9BN35_9GLOM|nr:4107_t:CDS:2 [Dentiscutata erythropus]
MSRAIAALVTVFLTTIASSFNSGILRREAYLSKRAGACYSPPLDTDKCVDCSTNADCQNCGPYT